MAARFMALLPVWIAAACAFGATGASASEPFLLGPPESDGPVVVEIGFRLREINEVDEENETFSFGGALTLRWRDGRQAFDPAAIGAREKVYQGSFQFNEVFTGWWPPVTLANQSGSYERQAVLLRIRPDGSMLYTEAMTATAKSRMDLRRFPFDEQHFEAIFGILGFDKSEVVLVAEPEISARGAILGAISQWETPEVKTSVREYDINVEGRETPVTTFVVGLDMIRRPGFMLRLTIFPLVVLVVLSWSVFWMDRSSLGDRMDISFLGILTIVAYQIMFSGILPKISYPTLSWAFLTVSFATMCAAVVVNLVVAYLDRQGKSAVGDRLDLRCRVAFPAAYFGLNALVACYFFLVS